MIIDDLLHTIEAHDCLARCGHYPLIAICIDAGKRAEAIRESWLVNRVTLNDPFPRSVTEFNLYGVQIGSVR